MNSQLVPVDPVRRSLPLVLLLALTTASLSTSCSDTIAQLLSARRIAAELRVKFNQASDASTRAVMATTDEESVAFAQEAERAKQAVGHDAEALAARLRELPASDEHRLLEEFKQRFAEYQALDQTILELAVQNTNLKAQKLAFGPVQESADALQKSLDAVSRDAPPKSRCQVESIAARAVLAVRAVQILHAPHIAASSDAVRSRLEHDMDEQLALVRDALAALSLPSAPASARASAPAIAPAARAELTAANQAFARFNESHDQLIKLSRTNSNVRSLEMVLGKGRSLATACDASLMMLQDALARAGVKATR